MVVSFLSFCVDFGLLALLTERAGIFYLVSAAISFLAGTTMSYILSILWVFEVRRFSGRALEYLVFVLVGVIGLALNEGLLWLFTEPLAVHYLLSKVIAATIIFFWNFAARKRILFQ